MDRIDLHVEVPALAVEDLTREGVPAESSDAIRSRVRLARECQTRRFSELGIYENAQMSVRHLRRFCPLSSTVRNLLRKAISAFGLSARSYDRILRVARTIADLEGVADLESRHISEAISFRSLDRGVEGGRISNSTLDRAGNTT